MQRFTDLINYYRGELAELKAEAAVDGSVMDRIEITERGEELVKDINESLRGAVRNRTRSAARTLGRFQRLYRVRAADLERWAADDAFWARQAERAQDDVRYYEDVVAAYQAAADALRAIRDEIKAGLREAGRQDRERARVLRRMLAEEGF